MNYLCSENKVADQLHLYMVQLICAFVFSYAKSRFFHDTAHLSFSTFGLNVGFSFVYACFTAFL